MATSWFWCTECRCDMPHHRADWPDNPWICEKGHTIARRWFTEEVNKMADDNKDDEIARLREQVASYKARLAEVNGTLDAMIRGRDEARAVASAAVRWWESRRPVGWDTYAHMRAPRVNTHSESEAELAVLVAQYVGSLDAEGGDDE